MDAELGAAVVDVGGLVLPGGPPPIGLTLHTVDALAMLPQSSVRMTDSRSLPPPWHQEGGSQCGAARDDGHDPRACPTRRSDGCVLPSAPAGSGVGGNSGCLEG